MPILHWSPRSPYVRKAMVALHEKDLADKVETVRTHADPMIPHEGLMAINPLSKIPTLELEDGRVLFDSHVICEWADLESADGPQLFPADPAARLEAERDEALGTGLLDVALPWLVELKMRPEEQRSEQMLAVYRTKMNRVAHWLEGHAARLTERPFDIGHLSIGVALCYLDFRFDGEGWREGRPDLANWHAGFAERPSVQATTFRDDPRPT
ncbi:glutathione S-transferase family protein [Thioclava electrotropha]|uniref:Glutathione S-transferase family protein n=1 Tax=Thioclava electrotropha TaxID=1549850 RepID=A0ABX6YSW0_9RHOB|nr:glutathione S-transferase N-terminal domain-containing protein [Thioclava electrotropha]QPZ90909.1 glutathione S-transferase family protein [Thioclava electrotropha]